MTELGQSGRRIVTPEEAQAALGSEDIDLAAYNLGETCLLYTVATEPDRIRAAVSRAMQEGAGMSEPRIVPPEKGNLPDEKIVSLAREGFCLTDAEVKRLGDLVATEPERTRAAVVKALREMSTLRRGAIFGVEHVPAQWIDERADAIENGADL